MFTEVVHTFILQAHAIEHASSRLRHTGIVVALTRIQGRSLDDDATQLIEGYEVLELQSIAESA